MRRGLDLAAALVARPPVLFLDGPTTGLQPRSQIELWAVIEDLVREGNMLLLTTDWRARPARRPDLGRRPRQGHRRGHLGQLKAKLGMAVSRSGWRRDQAQQVAKNPRRGRRRRPDHRRRPGPGAGRGTGRGRGGPALDARRCDGPRAATARAQAGRRVPRPHRRLSRTARWATARTSRRARQGRSDERGHLCRPAGGASSWALRDTGGGRPQPARLRALPDMVMFTPWFRRSCSRCCSGMSAARSAACGAELRQLSDPRHRRADVLFSAGTTGFALADDKQKGFVKRLRSCRWPGSRSPAAGGVRHAGQRAGAGGAADHRLRGRVPAGQRAGLWRPWLCCCCSRSRSAWATRWSGWWWQPGERNAATFPIIFPLTFASSAFVPVETMPSWPQGFATHEPVSVHAPGR